MEQNQGREGRTSWLVELIVIERLDWHHQIFFKKAGKYQSAKNVLRSVNSATHR